MVNKLAYILMDNLKMLKNIEHSVQKSFLSPRENESACIIAENLTGCSLYLTTFSNICIRRTEDLPILRDVIFIRAHQFAINYKKNQMEF